MLPGSVNAGRGGGGGGGGRGSSLFGLFVVFIVGIDVVLVILVLITSTAAAATAAVPDWRLRRQKRIQKGRHLALRRCEGSKSGWLLLLLLLLWRLSWLRLLSTPLLIGIGAPLLLRLRHWLPPPLFQIFRALRPWHRVYCVFCSCASSCSPPAAAPAAPV